VLLSLVDASVAYQSGSIRQSFQLQQVKGSWAGERVTVFQSFVPRWPVRFMGSERHRSDGFKPIKNPLSTVRQPSGKT
jgi:hypothetical protein